MTDKTLEFSLTPVDNRALANLCGTLDENLRLVERSLGVAISRRAGQFAVRGEANTALAAETLRRLYSSAANPLSPNDVHLALIEVNRGTIAETPGPRTAATAGEGLRTRRVDLRGRTPAQAAYIASILAYDITFAIGPAGTGKTYLAVACAVDALERDSVERIVLVRPAVEAGERLGFLPGDLAQKVDPYLRPLYDALYDLAGFDHTVRLLERGAIEIAPLAYMRGRTLNRAFVILDEAQNTTPEQMKMFLTRIGFGTRAVITGDVTQIDLQKNQKSGLVDAAQALDGLAGIAFARFSSADVVRHPLVQKIIDAYDRHEQRNPRA